MRSSQKSNRSRGKSNRKNVGNNVNRVYESAGPDGKVRGTPQQIIDKYNALARDSQTSGDRVAAENFLQHAEHYQRLLASALAASNERREQANANGAQQQQPPQQSQQPAESADAAASDAAQAEPGAVNGMATIDGADENAQLVDTPETERRKSTPRTRRPRTPRNGGGDKAKEASPAAEADTPEAVATPEATESDGAGDESSPNTA